MSLYIELNTYRREWCISAEMSMVLVVKFCEYEKGKR